MPPLIDTIYTDGRWGGGRLEGRVEGNCVLETSIETRRKPQRRSGDPGWACVSGNCSAGPKSG